MQGIPIDELIVWNEKLRRMDRASGDTLPEDRELVVVKPNRAFDELDLIRGMEEDFALQAESLLERLQLSHLRADPLK